MSRLAARACIFLVAGAIPAFCLVLLSRAPAHAAGAGNVLVVMAHPDDEGLGTAGIIANAKAAGRRVYVAIATNGEQGGPDPTSMSYCGAASNDQRGAARLGLLRDGETITAMGWLDLMWNTNENATDVFFLGYPDSRLEQMGDQSGPITSDGTGLHHTYAREAGGTASDPCNGDLAYLVTGAHSSLTRADFAMDMDRLLALTQPTDIYTHVDFDGHSDHREVARQAHAAADRSGLTVTVHGTLIHPEDTDTCSNQSSYEWPNPSGNSSSPGYDRFTPTLEFGKPPTPPCASSHSGSSWGPDGAPDEWVSVPSAMQSTSEGSNLKWKVIESYDSQINCSPISPGTYYFTCGYMRAFVKQSEFFWTTGYNGGGAPPDVIPPYKPAKPTAVSLDKSARINLSPLNDEPDLASYKLQRKKNSDGSGRWTSVKTGITSWPQTNTGLTNGTAYNFRVIAVDNAGNDSAPSDPVTVTPADVTAPAKPATPTATALDAAVRVGLSPLNGEGDLASYTLQRKKSGDASWASVKTGITAWPVTDGGLTNGTAYDFRVIAVDNATNQSTPSNAVSATPLAAPAPAPPVLVPVTPPTTDPITPIGKTVDLIAPKLTFHRPAKRTLASLGGKGFTVRVRCSEACTLTGRLDLLVAFTNRAGKRKVNAHLVGTSGKVSISGAGTAKLTVKITRAGRRLLAGKRGRVSLTVIALDGAGNRARAARTVTITR